MNIKTILIALGVLIVFPTFVLAQLTPKEELGKKIFFDKISSPDWMACANCHAPEVGFTGPIPGINLITAVYFGAVPQRFGNRKPPSAAYATLSPIFYYDDDEGLFIGGNFWDGRATGDKLGNPAGDQALGPFLNPVEQNNASKLEVLTQIANSRYAYLWEEVWGSPLDLNNVDMEYDRVGLAIAEYEASDEVNQFTSKYDYYLKDMVELTEQEEDGLELFNDPEKGNCAACHPSEGEQPLFTDFSFDNLGTPKNPDNPFYDMDVVLLDDGSPINPDGANWIDPGLGGFLDTFPESSFEKNKAAENLGKHKVPTLRNVDKRPGNGFIKAYMHNGVFKSLKEVVHFYNTRDVPEEDWPAPEVSANVNFDELGDLGLNDNEEDAIVAFMKTLSDGYKLKIKKEGIDLMVSEKSTSLRVEGPNPFNPSTRLGYYIPEDANIQLQVFNITGEKVATRHSGFMSAGEHQVEFNGNNLATGIYLVSLYTGKELITVKLMLMK